MTLVNPKVKLGILISYYQDMKCLNKCLHSLHNAFFQTPDWFTVCLIMMDGRYKGYQSSEYRGNLSSSDVHEMIYDHFAAMCDEYDNPEKKRFSYVHRIPAESSGPFPGKHKRQTLMNMAANADCDFALVLDSDEYLDNDRRHGAAMWPDFVNEMKFIKYQHPTKYHIYGVRFQEYNGIKSADGKKWLHDRAHRPRLFFHPEDIRYTDNHYTFNFPGEPKLNMISPVTIYHNPGICRNRLRIRDMDYYKLKSPWLVE